VVMEWDGSPPHRAPSTDWTPLEMGLYHYREELSKKQKMLPREEFCDCSKVRYNDTGSLEEVSSLIINITFWFLNVYYLELNNIREKLGQNL
jgi:hypothetical protein